MGSPKAQISLQTLSGHLAPKTLRLVGQIAQQEVIILIDGGSTHNFVQENLVLTLGLPSRPITLLRVMVGNGHEIECRQLCEQVLAHVQGQAFSVDLYVLPLCSADLVLGVQWLKSLGPILTDYNDLTMKFLRSGRVVELKGDNNSKLCAISPPQLHRLMQIDGANEFFHIHLLVTELRSTQTPPSISAIPKIASLITQVEPLFQTLTTLPLPETGD